MQKKKKNGQYVNDRFVTEKKEGGEGKKLDRLVISGLCIHGVKYR